MTRTPENQRQLMQTFCNMVSDYDIVNECMINDFGRYGNFEIFIFPHKMEKSNTNKLKKIVRVTLEQLKANSEDIDALKLHLRQYIAPVAKRTWCSYDEISRISGYDREFWSFDIDFSEYNSEENFFPEYQNASEA